jgi:DNA-binding transcriptional LysR family regulator
MKWDDRIGRRVKLHDLHILMTVAELGSMGKAAERLAVSQPSVSKSITDLEYVVGVRLLDRTSRGVETTAYGRALLRRGMGAFDELRQGIKDIEFLTDPTVGEVRVGCPEATSAGLLSAVIDRFSRQYPRAIVSVIPADNMSLEFGQLRDRRVDFLLGRIAKPFTDDDLEAEVLYQDRLFIVSGRNSRWARRRKFKLAELVDEPWVLTPSMHSTLLAEAFQASGFGHSKGQRESLFHAPEHQLDRHRPLHFCAIRFRAALWRQPIPIQSIADRFSGSAMARRGRHAEKQNGKPRSAELPRLCSRRS